MIISYNALFLYLGVIDLVINIKSQLLPERLSAINLYYFSMGSAKQFPKQYSGTSNEN